jgi:hypothetical protein
MQIYQQRRNSRTGRAVAVLLPQFFLRFLAHDRAGVVQGHVMVGQLVRYHDAPLSLRFGQFGVRCCCSALSKKKKNNEKIVEGRNGTKIVCIV